MSNSSLSTPALLRTTHLFSLLSTKHAESFSALSSQRRHSNSINTPAVSCFLLSAIAARVSLTANNPTTVPLGPGIRWPTSHSRLSGGDYNVTQCNGRAYVGLSVFPVYRRQRRVCCCGPGWQAISTVPWPPHLAVVGLLLWARRAGDIHRPMAAALGCSGFAAVGPAGRRYRSTTAAAAGCLAVTAA